jgi:hypothetical protein
MAPSVLCPAGTQCIGADRKKPQIIIDAKRRIDYTGTLNGGHDE